MINVTKTFLPPLEEYIHYLNGIWERNWITNHGPLVHELEEKLKSYLKVKHLFFVNNGTTALQVALKALEIEGEVLTTPFSYVATTSSIVWLNNKPVFVDIEPDTLCINPHLIEAQITNQTKCILATHVYGIPCNVDAINTIAQKYNLKVIYDAAHAFGVQYKEQSILNYGDISTLSLHATKLFHTGEGGAIVTNDDALAFKIKYMINFGHDGYEKFFGLGINGKNCELHAAMGLCLLPKLEDICHKRKLLSELYAELLQGLCLKKPKINKDVFYNYAYYPVIFPTEQHLLKTIKDLNAHDIFPRRYFYPSLNKLDYVKEQKAAVSEEIASKVLCLPLYYDLSEESIIQIVSIIKRNLINPF